MKKLAVIFPGVGYHTDKPLLYYSKKLASRNGYEIVEVPYGKFPKSAVEQAEEILKAVDFSGYDDILFISKSVGTAVSSAYAGKYHLKTRNIYYTPVEASFQSMTQPGIAFTGTKDSWVDHVAIKEGCEKGGFPLHITEDADHSLETGNVLKDLENLREIMRVTEEYIVGNSDEF